MKLIGNLHNYKGFIVFLIGFSLLCLNCEKGSDKPGGNNKITLSSATVSNLGYFTINVSGSITQTGGQTLTDHGFCYGTSPNPDINANVKSLGKRTEPGDFSAELTNLEDNHKYFIRAFATIAGVTLYGEQKEITTLKTGKPSISTSTFSDITLTSAICGGEIESDSGYAITTSGICWDTDNQFNETQCLGKEVNTSGNKTFSLIITGLNEGATYYVKAYATNHKGTGYGEVRQFCTIISTIPTVTTNEVTDITHNSAICGGNVTNGGGSTVTARGIIWDTTSNPTLQNNINYTFDWQGLGPFTNILGSLIPATKYYVRAYATNSEGTAYADNIESFTTLSPPLVCGTSLSLLHTSGTVAPVNKTVIYNTVETNLSGNNKCWITQNLGADHQATAATDATEASAGWYWQFNLKQGFKHDGTTRTPNTSWIYQIIENSDWLPANDPCKLLLGSGWRLPTSTEWQTADNTGYWDNYNETFASVLKLHAAGYLSTSEGSLYSRGSDGYYWSSSQNDSDLGRFLSFNSDNSYMNYYYKASGHSARCLRD